MQREFSRFAIPSVLMCAMTFAAVPARAAEPPPPLYVATTGLDTNAGTKASPLKTLTTALQKAQSYNTIYLRGGTYSLKTEVAVGRTGAYIRAYAGETVIIENGGFSGTLFDITAASVTLDGVLLDGRFQSNARAIQGRSTASHLAVRNCEIRNFTNHAVDVDGTDVKITGCHIHHILRYSATDGRVDAHGVVTLNAQRLLIQNCDIHHVSGDCFQADRGSWQDITIEGCKLWDAPLDAALAGFAAGDRTAENAVDTKRSETKSRARLVIKSCNLTGFRSNLISNSAALNLKENIDAVVLSSTVSDSYIGLRLRGRTGNTGAWLAMGNSLIRTCSTAVRYEDSAQNFRFVHNTIYNCSTRFKRAPSDSSWGQGWVVANNLFINISTLPVEAPAPLNAKAPTSTINTTTLKPVTSAGIVGAPVANVMPSWYSSTALARDKAGVLRSTTTPTMGAFEYVPPA